MSRFGELPSAQAKAGVCGLGLQARSAWRERAGFRLVLAGLLLCAGAAYGQQAELSGLIQDASGAAVSGASVEALNLGTNIRQATTTNESGLYILAPIQPGAYRVTVEAFGFQRTVIESLELAVAAKVTRNVQLKIGSVSENITISAAGLNVNTVDATVSTVVDHQFVSNMPLNGRSFQSLLTMVPGVTAVPSSGAGFGGEVTVNGQRTEANYFTIDGVSANTGALTITNSSGVGRGAGFSGSTPSVSAIGTTQTLVSVDALQEFRATTSTYSAEYGRTPGGQFSFLTRSGTNQLHGSLFEYFRNDKLDANNWFNNRAGLPRQAERQNDFGGTVGGPLRIPRLYDGRDRTFYFFSYEGLRLRTPQAAMTYDVPSLSLRANAPTALQPFLNAFPIPNGPESGNGLASFTGGYSSPSNLDSTGIRMDHSVSDSLKVFGRFSSATSSNTTRQTPNMANRSAVSIDVKTLTLGATQILSPRISNEARMNLTWNDSLGSFTPDNFGGATPFQINQVPGLSDPNANLFFYLNFGLQPVLRIIPRDIQQRQFNITDNVTMVFGRHTVKVGLDYRRIKNNQPLPSVYEYPVFLNAAQVLQNSPQFVTLFRFTGGAMQPIYDNFSTFAQDEWKVNRRLSLSFGLRWDINPAPHDAAGNDPYTLDQTDNLVTAKLAPQGTPLWKTSYTNFAPRLGGAYHLYEKPGRETVLRAGFGIFYDTGNTLGTMGYWGVGISGSSSLTGVGAPLTQAQIDSVPKPGTATPYETNVYAYDPNLKLPYSRQWNVAIEQSLGEHQTLTVNYVGSAGRRLLLWRQYLPGRLGNLNFKPVNQTGFGNSLQLTTNGTDSDYHALQIQFQRKLSHGLQAMGSYTWSHSIDTASTNFQVYQVLRASSDFDIRHNVQAAVTYDLPEFSSQPVLHKLIHGFAVDTRFAARSALPVDLVGVNGLDPATGSTLPYHPDVVPGQPYYIDDVNAPGGRRINFAAFKAAPDGVEGNAGRNVVRGFASVQTDLSIRRRFALGERTGVQFRAEAFNVFNQVNLGSIYPNLSYGASRFGYAYQTLNAQLGGVSPIYQTGGPRSIQLSLRLSF